jgi:hypothetical protein
MPDAFFAGSAPLLGVNFGWAALRLTLRRPRSGRLEGWGTVAMVRLNGFQTARAVPHPSRRALGALLRVRSSVELAPMRCALPAK